jgi:ribulose-bisphosphate carboxylase small chain
MRLTQGQFSFLPDLTDAEIKKQVDYALENGWAVAIEYTDDPHPKNYFWSMWGHPMFDLTDPAGIMLELNACRAEHANKYIKIQAFDSRKGWESIRMSFVVNRPKDEPGFMLERGGGRNTRYTLHSYAANQPQGRRYP